MTRTNAKQVLKHKGVYHKLTIITNRQTIKVVSRLATSAFPTITTRTAALLITVTIYREYLPPQHSKPDHSHTYRPPSYIIPTGHANDRSPLLSIITCDFYFILKASITSTTYHYYLFAND
eukprot:gene8782-1157_t